MFTKAAFVLVKATAEPFDRQRLLFEIPS